MAFDKSLFSYHITPTDFTPLLAKVFTPHNSDGKIHRFFRIQYNSTKPVVPAQIETKRREISLSKARSNHTLTNY